MEPGVQVGQESSVTQQPPFDELAARIALLQASGIGPVRAGDLLDAFGAARDIFLATDVDLQHVRGMSVEAVKKLRMARREPTVFSDRKTALREGYSLCCITESPYPHLLRSIYAPPSLLWATGSVFPDDYPSVAIVGTRRPSPNGKSVAYALSYELASSGYTIISGLAHGIDAIAHRAALDAGGRTIAVLGSGLSRLYPRANESLAKRIRLNGLLVSEFPLTMEAHPGHFPRRNRIISGLAQATIVVEAYESGGALLTARIALDQNRDVYAVPGVVGNPAAQGTNRLIQKGEAQLLMSARDLLADGFAPTETPESASTIVSAESQTVLQALSSEPVHIDDLSANLEWPTSRLLIVLLRLECTQRVRQLPGKYFTLAPRR